MHITTQLNTVLLQPSQVKHGVVRHPNALLLSAPLTQIPPLLFAQLPQINNHNRLLKRGQL